MALDIEHKLKNFFEETAMTAVCIGIVLVNSCKRWILNNHFYAFHVSLNIKFPSTVMSCLNCRTLHAVADVAASICGVK